MNEPVINSVISIFDPENMYHVPPRISSCHLSGIFETGRWVRVSDKEDSKRFEIILKTGNRVKTCIEIRKRESIVCLAIIGWTAVRRRVIIIERSATILPSPFDIETNRFACHHSWESYYEERNLPQFSIYRTPFRLLSPRFMTALIK